MGRGAAEFAKYGPALRRVRAGERFADEGGKSVWHQAAPGIEIISFVDEGGRALRQECYLAESALIWLPGAPLASATVDPGRGGRVGSEVLRTHDRLDAEVLASALAMLEAAPRGDRYLDHLRAELLAAQRGLASDDDDPLTSTVRRPGLVEDAPPRPPPRRRWVMGAVVVAAAAVLIWLVLR